MLFVDTNGNITSEPRSFLDMVLDEIRLYKASQIVFKDNPEKLQEIEEIHRRFISKCTMIEENRSKRRGDKLEEELAID